MVVVALFPGQLAPHRPSEYFEEYLPASWNNPLGTDRLGRDTLSRLIWGARVSIPIGVASVTIGVTLGLILGLVSGYVRGVFDLATQRFVDAMMAFPGLVLAILWLTLFGASAYTLILAITINLIAPTARVLRGSTLAITEATYIEAAKAVGCSTSRILLRHIFPNVRAIYVVLISPSVGGAIITESSLSFLGLGVSPDTPTWGQMVNAGTRDLFLVSWWMPVPAAVCIALAVYGFNMLGDALRDVWDPRLRGAQ
jgi:peptide/nickel transport system permease protein